MMTEGYLLTFHTLFLRLRALRPYQGISCFEPFLEIKKRLHDTVTMWWKNSMQGNREKAEYGEIDWKSPVNSLLKDHIV